MSGNDFESRINSDREEYCVDVESEFYNVPDARIIELLQGVATRPE